MNSNNMKKWWLYVLELEESKYYVGITSQTPEVRMQEHINHIRAAYWTMKYKPVGLEYKEDLGKVSKEEAEVIENRKTRELIKIHGVNNVRGGDIKMTYEMIRRFGYFYKMDDWETITTVTFLCIIIAILTAALVLR
jgi:predicted GIY-YIG superfamily endonuclease